MHKLKNDSGEEALLVAEIAPPVGRERRSLLIRMATFPAQSLSFTLIAIGLLISIYHRWRLVVLSGRWSGKGTDVCLAMFGVGCDAMLASPASVQFGLPVAGWGLIYYVTLGGFVSLASILGETFELEARYYLPMTLFRTRSICWTLIAVGLVISSHHLWRRVVLAGQSKRT